MPYILPKNRPAIDACVEMLADELVAEVTRTKVSVEITELYRRAFDAIAAYLSAHAQMRTTVMFSGTPGPALSSAEKVAQSVLDAAKGYGQKGGWFGELNYAIMTLILKVPHKLYKNRVWDDPLRYWLYAETVGALTRTVHELLTRHGGNWISNGLAGVFEDVKDEYKRRVGAAYQTAQLVKNGDCFSLAPYRTQLVETDTGGMKGWTEMVLLREEPLQPAGGQNV